jgi:hydrogenase small subunit
MTRSDDGLLAALLERGVSRRSLLKFSAAMAATLALPAAYAPRIGAAVAGAPRMPLVWLHGQACGGNTAAFLRTADPTVAQLLLDVLSVEYHESLMVAAGGGAALSLGDTMERYPNGYIAVVEGSLPTADDGVPCLVGGRPFGEVAREVCDGAAITIAVGSCAFDGGAPAAAGGTTGATGAIAAVSDGPVVALPGCPLNPDNLAATIVHYLAFKELPPSDGRHRPYFAYGGLIHNQCERRAFFEFGQFVQAWGDEGAQKGWCLYKMGCKGPQSFANCATARYAEQVSWPVHAGHGCIACTMPDFWDAMGPAYARLPAPMPFLPQVTVDHVGQLLVAGVGAVTVAHGTASYLRNKQSKRAERRAAAAEPAGPPAATGLEEPATALAVAPPTGPAEPAIGLADALEPPAEPAIWREDALEPPLAPPDIDPQPAGASTIAEPAATAELAAGPGAAAGPAACPDVDRPPVDADPSAEVR